MSPAIAKCLALILPNDKSQLITTVLRSKGPGNKGITKEVSMCEVGQQGDGGEGQGIYTHTCIPQAGAGSLTLISNLAVGLQAAYV